MHLWEVDHAYYCNEGNYFANDCGFDYESWDHFISEMGDADWDYNLLFRWDWVCAEETNKSNSVEDEPDSSDYMHHDELKLFFMGQRKGLYTFAVVKVNKEDEPRVIEYLKPRLDYLKKLWEPLT